MLTSWTGSGVEMAKLPGLRQGELRAALSCLTAAGLKPSRLRVTRDGSFELDLDGGEEASSASDLDRELAEFEALKHGLG